MQMLFGNMNVGAANPTFEVFPKVFHAVDVRFANNIFLRSVVNGLMFVTLLPKSIIGAQLVSVNRRTGLDVLFDDWFKRLAFAVRYHLRHHLSLALHHFKANRLVGRTATAHTGAITAKCPTDIDGDLQAARDFIKILPSIQEPELLFRGRPAVVCPTP